MIKEGFVSLFTENEKLIINKKYSNHIELRIIIEGWEKSYGENMTKYIVQIAPLVTDEKELMAKRKPIKTPCVKKIPEKQPEKFVRPKAVYDNNKSLYGIDYGE